VEETKSNAGNVKKTKFQEIDTLKLLSISPRRKYFIYKEEKASENLIIRRWKKCILILADIN
jgi:hypothetical protein